MKATEQRSIKLLVSEEEKQWILGRRSEEKRKQNAHLWTVKLIQTAHEYQLWLMDKKLGASFSGFIEDFGYEGGESKLMYEMIKIHLNQFDEMLEIKQVQSILEHLSHKDLD